MTRLCSPPVNAMQMALSEPLSFDFQGQTNRNVLRIPTGLGRYWESISMHYSLTFVADFKARTTIQLFCYSHGQTLINTNNYAITWGIWSILWKDWHSSCEVHSRNAIQHCIWQRLDTGSAIGNAGAGWEVHGNTPAMCRAVGDSVRKPCEQMF